MEYVATCLFGLERLVGEEIDALGYKRTSTLDGRVIFEGDESAAARFNIFSRYAERLYLRLGEFHASSFAELFDGTKALPWEDYIGKLDAFPVKGHSIKSALTSIPDCQSIVKKAIVNRLGEKYGIKWFDESAQKYQVEFFILKDEASLMIDLSGVPLHKRGYRPESNAAPIRETLAAALVSLARPREDVLFWDPMCGSGTIPIEAAMMMTKTAPGANRTFVCERYPRFEKKLFFDARNEARDTRIKSDFEAYASDIDSACVALTADNVRRAGMEDNIKVFHRDALKIETGGRRGTVVCNPPYGERLSDREECERLYRAMGRHFATLDSWQIYIICSNENFERLYGRRADKVRVLYNGMIKCNYYQFFKNKK